MKWDLFFLCLLKNLPPVGDVAASSPCALLQGTELSGWHVREAARPLGQPSAGRDYPERLCSLQSYRVSTPDLTMPWGTWSDLRWHCSEWDVGLETASSPFRDEFFCDSISISSHLQREERSKRISCHFGSHTPATDLCSWKRLLALPPPTCRLPQIPLQPHGQRCSRAATSAIEYCEHRSLIFSPWHDKQFQDAVDFFLSHYKLSNLFWGGLTSRRCKEGLVIAGTKQVIPERKQFLITRQIDGPFQYLTRQVTSTEKNTLFLRRELRNKLRKKTHIQKNHLYNKSEQLLTHLTNPFAHTRLPAEPSPRCAPLSIPLPCSPWEAAEVPRQLREVVCIPDSCTTQIFKQCLEPGKKKTSHFLEYDTTINFYQLLKALPKKVFLKQFIWSKFLIIYQIYWGVRNQIFRTKLLP